MITDGQRIVSAKSRKQKQKCMVVKDGQRYGYVYLGKEILRFPASMIGSRIQILWRYYKENDTVSYMDKIRKNRNHGCVYHAEFTAGCKHCEFHKSVTEG